MLKPIKKAYRWKQELRGIDEQSLTIEEEKRRIHEWLDQAGAVYNKVITTITLEITLRVEQRRESIIALI
ncbi:hypothetical protein [Parathermosynechococcus lividus]